MSAPICPISTTAVRDELMPRLMRDGDDEAWDVVDSLCAALDESRSDNDRLIDLTANLLLKVAAVRNALE